MNRLFFLFALSLVFSSCIVSKKKFDDMLAQKIKAEGELSDKSKKLDRANTSINQFNESISKLRQDSIDLNRNIQTNTKN